ncbi:TPM domain-containing protein [Edaphobacter aggregans]|uniref:TPM domain-containing protein n=1 Tax=Edaphobacter aggregans TaxID=570835 RepID=UPI000555A8F3|nr:TPM domain-containing protein [Edaphobacter aggregans]
MKRITRWLGIVLLLLAPGPLLVGESVKSLPKPTGYISDFAGVLSPSTKQDMEVLCTQVDRQAHAQIAVVTIKTLDDDQTIEEFATELEDKWGVGNKDDRGVLMVLVMTPRKGRIEVGYGLEGILNDAKVGDIGRSMVPAASRGDYDTAVPLGVRQIAGIIAQDAGVTLALPTHQYHREPVRDEPVQISLMQIVIGGGVVLLLLFFLVRTGNIGLIFFLLGNLMGGGGGGGYRGERGRDRRDGGGGFGGFGGGRSGGGGADF